MRVTRSQYPYPPDEFDARTPGDAPVGVHRVPPSRWSGVWPFLLVAVIAVGLAVGGVWYLSRDKTPVDDLADGGTTATAPVEGEGAETPAEGDGTGESPADEAPEGETPAAETPDAETPAAGDLATLLQAANLDSHVRVLNDCGSACPAGEAGRAKDALVAQGFTTVDAENWPGGTAPSVTSIWYAEGKADSATAVAAVLGVDAANVSEQTLRNGDILVIIKSPLTSAG